MKEVETFAQTQGMGTIAQEVSFEGPRNKGTMSQFGDGRLATFVEGQKLCRAGAEPIGLLSKVIRTVKGLTAGFSERNLVKPPSDRLCAPLLSNCTVSS